MPSVVGYICFPANKLVWKLARLKRLVVGFVGKQSEVPRARLFVIESARGPIIVVCPSAREGTRRSPVLQSSEPRKSCPLLSINS